MIGDKGLHVLLMPLYGIGDALMATPAIRNIKERLGARITFLHMFKTTRDIMLNNPNVDENIHFPFLEAGKTAGVRYLLGLRGRFDVSINFYPSNRKDYNMAAFLAGCPVRIGHRYRIYDLRELNFLKNRTFMESDDLHNVEEDLRLLSFLGISDPEAYPLEIHLAPEEEEAATMWLVQRGIGGRRLVGLHPGSSLFKESGKKRWPQEKFSALVGRLAEARPDIAFLLFGGPEERELKEAVKAGCKAAEAHMVEAPLIRETAALIRKCSLFVTNDSGLMHIAAAGQVPTVAIFGPTNPKWLHPWKCPSKVVRTGRECGPCFRYSPIPQRCIEGLDFSCLGDIDVNEVFEAALSLPQQE
jgi:heptosyltransferase-2